VGLRAVLNNVDTVPASESKQRVQVARQPARCTATMARVRGVSTAPTVSAVMVCVSRSTSAKTGRAPHLAAHMPEATNVRAGTITSSPAPIPNADSAISSATLPLHTATPYLQPAEAANSCSNLRPCSPVE
jgi:hypothetical protein